MTHHTAANHGEISGKHNSITGVPCRYMRLRNLGMALSKLEGKENLEASLEQYSTPGDLASRWLFDIMAFGDLTSGCRVLDLGSGNGILGIGAVMLGAGYVTLVEADETFCEIAETNAEKNLQDENYDIINQVIGVDALNLGDIDLIITNPPWGRLSEGADACFLDLISSLGVTTHVMHSAKAKHIQKIFENLNWTVEKYGEADFPLPASYGHHKMHRGSTRAGFWRLSPP